MHPKLLIDLHYLPSVTWFSLFRRYDSCYLEQSETYQKRSFRNRAHIAGANGKQVLSIPLAKGKNEGQLITEVRIAYRENWQQQHWQSIQSAYGKSPFFEYYEELFKEATFQEATYLVEYNLNWLGVVLKILKWKGIFRFTSDYEINPPEAFFDARSLIHPKKELPSSITIKPYGQVFEEVHGFLPNLSILDLLCCTGPEADFYL